MTPRADGCMRMLARVLAFFMFLPEWNMDAHRLLRGTLRILLEHRYGRIELHRCTRHPPVKMCWYMAPMASTGHSKTAN